MWGSVNVFVVLAAVFAILFVLIGAYYVLDYQSSKYELQVEIDFDGRRQRLVVEVAMLYNREYFRSLMKTFDLPSSVQYRYDNWSSVGMYKVYHTESEFARLIDQCINGTLKALQKDVSRNIAASHHIRATTRTLQKYGLTPSQRL